MNNNGYMFHIFVHGELRDSWNVRYKKAALEDITLFYDCYTLTTRVNSDFERVSLRSFDTDDEIGHILIYKLDEEE